MKSEVLRDVLTAPDLRRYTTRRSWGWRVQRVEKLDGYSEPFISVKTELQTIQSERLVQL